VIAPLRWLQALVRIALITWQEAELNRLNLRAGALTYALLLSMVPLLAMSTAVVKGLGGGDQLRGIVYKYIDTLEATAPTIETGSPLTTGQPTDQPTDEAETGTDQSANLTGHLRSAANQIFDYVDRTNFATLGTFGMLGIFLSAILVLGQIETAMNTIWHVKNGRSILRKIADYMTLMVLMPISLNVAFAAGTILKSQSLGLHLDQYIAVEWLQGLLLNGVPILVLTLTLYVAYLFFPNTKVKPLPTMIGALLGGGLWFVTQNLYISLQVGVANYNAIYGSFATIPLFLVWMYFGWLFILLGAQVAFAIQHCRGYRLVPRRPEPSTLLGAAFDLCNLVDSRFAEHRGTSFETAVAALPVYPPDLLEQVRDRLVAADLLHHSSETGALMPSSPPQHLSHHRIIETMLTGPLPDSQGGVQAGQAIATIMEASQAPSGNPDQPSGDERAD